MDNSTARDIHMFIIYLLSYKKNPTAGLNVMEWLHFTYWLSPHICINPYQRAFLVHVYYHCAKQARNPLLTTMWATSKKVLFPGHNHLLTTGTDDPSLDRWCSGYNQTAESSVPVVSRRLWPGNRTFSEVVSIVVTWWIVAFLHSVGTWTLYVWNLVIEMWYKIRERFHDVLLHHWCASLHFSLTVFHLKINIIFSSMLTDLS